MERSSFILMEPLIQSATPSSVRSGVSALVLIGSSIYVGFSARVWMWPSGGAVLLSVASNGLMSLKPPRIDSLMGRVQTWPLWLPATKMGQKMPLSTKQLSSTRAGSDFAEMEFSRGVDSLISKMRFAVLVDAENTQYSLMAAVMEELAKFGATSIRFVYGDFTKPQLLPWRNVALELSFSSINTFSYTPGKGSSDAAMLIDAMDILHTNNAVDGFVLVTSDSDFTGLAQRLRRAGKMVLGVGKEGTPTAFVTACDRFIYLENLAQASEVSEGARPIAPRRKRTLPRRTIKLLQKCVADLADENGWANLGQVGAQVIQRKPDFDTRSYGFPRLGALFRALPQYFRERQIRSQSYVALTEKPLSAINESVLEQAPMPPALGEQVSFSSLEIRVGKVVETREFNSTSTVSFTAVDALIDVGNSCRRFVSKYKGFDERNGTRCLLLCNVPDQNYLGVNCSCRVLVACDAEGNEELVQPPLDAAPGDRVLCAGIEDGDAMLPQRLMKSRKIFLRELAVNDGMVTFMGMPLMTSAGLCTASHIAKGNITFALR